MALIRGTVYKMTDDEGFFYFGSTITTLAERLNAHKKTSKKYPKSKVYSQFSFEKFCQNIIKMEVIEQVVVENQKELRMIENQYITKYRNDLKLLNTIKAFISEEELKEYHKEWREQNYEYKKQWQQQYKPTQAKKDKERYEKYKNIIINCECGEEVKKSNLSHHKKSQHHQDFIANNN